MTSGADWLDSARRLRDALRPPAGTSPADAGHDGADCQWCPMCQAAAVLRGDRPAVSAALADVLATTAAALRELAGEPGRPATAPDQQGPPDSGSPDGGSRDEGPGPGPVQRIDIA